MHASTHGVDLEHLGQPVDGNPLKTERILKGFKETRGPTGYPRPPASTPEDSRDTP